MQIFLIPKCISLSLTLYDMKEIFPLSLYLMLVLSLIHVDGNGNYTTTFSESVIPKFRECLSNGVGSVIRSRMDT
jgi:hypothetical protein